MKFAALIYNILKTFELERSILVPGSDKGSHHSYVDHVYGPIFDVIPTPKSILEIGVQSGGSLVLWQKLFPNTQIVGVDVSLANFKNTEALSLRKVNKITVIEQDAYSTEFIEGLSDFDFIIDDGPHTHVSQILALNFTQKLTKSGTMVIEDIQPNYKEISDLISAARKIPNIYCSYINLTHIKGRYDDLVLVLTFNERVKKYLKLSEKTWPNRFLNSKFQFSISKMISIGKFYRKAIDKEFSYWSQNKKALLWKIFVPLRWK
jgi:hypothetical protein